MFIMDPTLWISVAAMQFGGVVARWLQGVQSKIVSMVFQRFGRNQHQTLVRPLYRLVQIGTVHEYIDQSAELVGQLSTYETIPDALRYTTRFLDG
jgi:hypothetical protein